MRRTDFFVVCALAVLQGCGSSVVQISRDEYDRLPRDSRQEIFDAENGLVIARNREDEAEDRRQSAERSLRELEERWSSTEKRLSSGNQRGRVSQARRVFDTKKAYLSALSEVADAGIRTTELETDLSRARLQLVRQRQLVRIGRVTIGSLKAFEEKVSDIEVKVKAAVAAQNNLRARAQTQLETWKSTEDEYARTSSDYDTGIWRP